MHTVLFLVCGGSFVFVSVSRGFIGRSWAPRLAAVFAVLSVALTGFLGAMLGASHGAASHSAAGGLWSDSGVVASADGGGLCSGMGYNMQRAAAWDSPGGFENDTAKRRVLSVEDLAANGTKFMLFYGTGKVDNSSGLNFVADNEVEFPEADHVDKAKADEVRKALGTGGCVTTGVGMAAANAVLNLNTMVLGLGKYVTVSAFNSQLICKDGNSKNCIDLVSVIGGKSDTSRDKGIIGVLTQGVYMPLLVMAVIIALALAAWKIIHGQIMAALREAVVAVVAAILGAGILAFPHTFASAPLWVMGEVGGIVANAVNGGGPNATSSESACVASADGESGGSLAISSVTCTMWKAFVANPVAIQTFGLPFDELDTKEGDFAARLKEKGFTGDEFCVPKNTIGALKDSYGKALAMNGGGSDKVCNLYAYAAMLRTNIDDGSGEYDASKTYSDPRWGRVIGAAQASDVTWLSFTSQAGALSAPMTAGGMLVTSILANIVFFVTGIWALVYYFQAIVVVAFAPFFLLLAISERTRKYFFGWLQQILGSVLKFLVSEVFLIIAVLVYGGALQTLSNPATATLVVIVLTVLLVLYRKEVIGMFGRVEMGGREMSSRAVQAASKFLGDNRRRAVAYGTAAVGGAVGGAIAAGKGERGAAMWEGLKEGSLRQASRSTGLIGHTARQVNAIDGRNKKDLQLAERDVKNQLNAMRNQDAATSGVAQNAKQNLDRVSERVADAKRNYNAFESDSVKRSHLIDEGENSTRRRVEKQLQDIAERKKNATSEADVDALNRAEARANMHLSVTEAVFKEAKADGLEADAVYARSIGDEKAASEFEKQAQALRDEAGKLREKAHVLSDGDNRAFQESMAEAKNRVESINEAVGNDAVTSASGATETVETVRGGDKLIADAQAEYEAASAEKAATEIHVSELKRQIQAIDKAQKQTGSRLLTSELRDVERERDASDAVIESAHADAKRGVTPVALDAGDVRKKLNDSAAHDATGGDAR